MLREWSLRQKCDDPMSTFVGLFPIKNLGYATEYHKNKSFCMQENVKNIFSFIVERKIIIMFVV